MISDHLTQVSKLIDEQLAKLGAGAIISSMIRSVSQGWMQDENFVKLMAGIDMFFIKFPNHDHSILRIGTIPTRYKDCGALTSLHALTEVIGINQQDLSKWMWTNFLCTEMMQLNVSGNELDRLDSYFPYVMEMRLSHKSPYSATVNPNIYLWTHVVGCTMKLKRSLNARMLEKANLHFTITNAAVVAYCLANTSSLTLQFANKADEIAYKKSQKRIQEAALIEAREKRAKQDAKEKEEEGDDAETDTLEDMEFGDDPNDQESQSKKKFFTV